jgi:inosine-uridine nucleoside N-ribohydrolase
VLARDDLEATLEPLLAAKSPLAEWVSAFMKGVFDKLEASSPGIPKNAVRVPVHDMLPIWYCMDFSNPKWEISKGEDLRVETVGQWTRGMFVTNRRSRKRKEDNCDDADGEVREGNGNGNRINRCVGSPGQDAFSEILLKRPFGS